VIATLRELGILPQTVRLPDALNEAKALIRRTQLRWDVVFSENGSSFHSSQEAARVLAGVIDFARQAELKASLLAPAAPRN